MNRIKEIRKRKNITAQDLASMLNVTKGYLSRLENNHKPLSSNMAKRIALCLDCEEEELYVSKQHIDKFHRSQADYLADYMQSRKVYISDFEVFLMCQNDIQMGAIGKKNGTRPTPKEARSILDMLLSAKNVENRMAKLQKQIARQHLASYDSSPSSPLKGTRIKDEKGNEYIYRAPKNKHVSYSEDFDTLDEMENELARLSLVMSLLNEYRRRIICGPDEESHFMLDYLHDQSDIHLYERYGHFISENGLRVTATRIIQKRIMIDRSYNLSIPESYIRDAEGED
jgi:transcriptional regulator with XRE-family HTH domain